jgi:hypothetical protein
MIRTTDDDPARFLDDLFFEQDTQVLATNYKHGVARSLAVLARTLALSGAPAPADIESGTCVAVAFFANERSAVQRAGAGLPRIDRVLELDVGALTLVRHRLGWVRMIAESGRFVRSALARKGRRYAGRLTYPLLGWLLYRTFRVMLAGKSDVSVVTTNMQHPLSIAVARAARDAGQRSCFVEHATTPRLVFRGHGYDRYHVAFAHTRQMLISCGVPAGSVETFEQAPPLTAPTMVRATGAAGLCVNILDSIEAIGAAVAALSRRGVKVILRAHDADLRISHLRALATRLGATFDSARASRIGDFLERVDVVVAGNSNVVGDALSAGKPVIYYWTGTPDMFDYYGLVEHYRVPCARSAAELEHVLDKVIGPEPVSGPDPGGGAMHPGD